MGLRYAAFHSFIHLLVPFALSYFFRLHFFQFFIVLIGAVIVDIDHFFLVARHGIIGAFRKVILQGFGKVRKYPLHNFFVIFLAAFGSFLIFIPNYLLYGIFSLAVFLHLLWDLFEDVAIFRVKPDNWKIKLFW